ncbi:MAG TPA: stage II sporulation protein M [Pseudobacteroides sp.]|uniref:stage II sporulation protein M n=1 Tax=Pseudobacteroides sp. TaxID=1968840 RepID=UPI002F94D3BF
MREEKFINDNSYIWSNLESLLHKLKARKLKTLSKSELESFITSYRIVCSHLSYSRTFFGESKTTEYLNSLASSAHGHIYSTRSSGFKKIFSFYIKGFPELLKDNAAYMILSTALFMAGVIFSFIMTVINSDNAPAFIPPELIEGVKTLNSGRGSWDSATQSASIFTNNIGVGLRAFALGITLGLGTTYILIFNGFILGSAAGLALNYNVTSIFWSLILPHGVLELFCIFVCGAAGLIIGKSIINPGIYSRKDSLIKGGKTAVYLTCGTIPLFIIAGIIEGYFTPSNASVEAKLVFSLVSFILVCLYTALPFIIRKKLSKDSAE